MAITVLTEDELLALILIYLQAAYPGRPVGPKSFLGQFARSAAQSLGAISQAVQAADDDGVPAYATADAVIRSRCSSEALDNWAVTFGLASNRGAGLFGRNGAFKATGGGGNVTGVIGSVQLGGSLLRDLSGTVEVQLVNTVTLPGSSAPGQFQATVAGAASNLPAGTQLQFTSPSPGINPYVILSTALSGGYDVESDLHLLERLINHLRNPPKGGTAADYRRWAEESTDSQGGSLGIGRAYVYPHRDGLGSEDIVITLLGGSGEGRGAAGISDAAARLAAVQAYLDAIRPVNDTPTAIWPYFDAARGLKIKLQVQPSAEYPWDWTGAPLALDSATADKVRILNASLTGTAFYQAFLDGKKPRIQVILPGFALPQVRQVVSATVPGITTEFQLSSALPAVPAPGTLIYPAGGAVLPAAVSVLNYIDNLGPSKQSGYHDAITDDWEALVTIGKIAWAALSAEDEIGQRVLVYSPSVGQGVGVQVAVGVGAYAAADVPLFDNWPPHDRGPELPWTVSILVLPVS